MPGSKLLYAAMAAAFIAAAAIVLWHSSGAGRCGIESCHGLEITCGPNVPDACTMEYQLGDSCRAFAGCEVIDGQCRSVKAQRFDECKSCVEKCLQDFPQPEDIELFQCESQCAQ